MSAAGNTERRKAERPLTVRVHSHDQIIAHGPRLAQLVGVAVVHHVIAAKTKALSAGDAPSSGAAHGDLPPAALGGSESPCCPSRRRDSRHRRRLPGRRLAPTRPRGTHRRRGAPGRGCRGDGRQSARGPQRAAPPALPPPPATPAAVTEERRRSAAETLYSRPHSPAVAPDAHGPLCRRAAPRRPVAQHGRAVTGGTAAERDLPPAPPRARARPRRHLGARQHRRSGRADAPRSFSPRPAPAVSCSSCAGCPWRSRGPTSRRVGWDVRPAVPRPARRPAAGPPASGSACPPRRGAAARPAQRWGPSPCGEEEVRAGGSRWPSRPVPPGPHQLTGRSRGSAGPAPPSAAA